MIGGVGLWMSIEYCRGIRNEQYRVYVGEIHASGTHLLRIVNDILDLSKAEAGKLTLEEVIFDVATRSAWSSS